jgi:hypothetical protein
MPEGKQANRQIVACGDAYVDARVWSRRRQRVHDLLSGQGAWEDCFLGWVVIGLLNELGLDPSTVFLILGMITVVTLGLYWRFFLNIFDPLLFFVVSTVASSILVLGLPWENELKVEFGLFNLALWLGFAIHGRMPKRSAGLQSTAENLFQLEVLLILLFCTILVGNLAVGFISGFPLFSNDPSVAKVTSYAGGLGFVRRINSMPFMFFASGCTLLAVLGYKRIQFLALLFGGCFLIVLTGSKSALTPVVFVLSLIVAHPAFMSGKKELASRLRRYAILAFALATVVAVLVPVIDTGSLGEGVALLAKRVLFNGDVVLYYFPTRGANPQLMHLGAWDYLAYLIQPILGMLRLAPVPDALGSVIMGTEDVGFGPNPQFYIRADIFFGPVRGCIYCFVIGYAISWMRRYFFPSEPVSPGSYVWRLSIAASAFTLATDSSLFIGSVFDGLLIIAPLWCLAHLLIVSSRSLGENLEVTAKT